MFIKNSNKPYFIFIVTIRCFIITMNSLIATVKSFITTTTCLIIRNINEYIHKSIIFE